MKLSRSVSAEVAAIGVAAFLIGALNVPFWRQLHAAVAPRDLYELAFIGVVGVLAFASLAWLLICLAVPYLFKPVVSLLVVATSAALYFMVEYGTVLDADMIRNILETNRAETAELMTGRLFLYVFFLGLLPAAVLWGGKIVYRPLWPGIWFKIRTTLAVAAAATLIALPFTQNLTSVFRQHRELLYVLMPFNYLSASAEVGRKSLRQAKAEPLSFGTDARRIAARPSHNERSLTVLVIGETARAANFSLNGYARDTNPELSKIAGLINYTRVLSCGTATAQSLPCMFSGVGRAGFDQRQAGVQEGLLHILQRAGFSVLWRENQGGCAGVCRGISTEFMEQAGTRKLFEIGESRDENLVAGLQEKFDAMPGHAVIVLHMMGSHGPAYHKRYPAAFGRFEPACRESQFSRCTRAEIVSAYDNTILYTDFVLAKLVELLQANDRAGTPSSMIYVSDHGESLGEANTYLHGLPYAIAPHVQKHVPMMVWLSPQLQAERRIDGGCLRRSRHEPLSHDHFFHSVLGLLDISTSVYNRGLDIFATCRGSGPRDDD
jgi:lipid A ethanolaminephosphotransferase